MAEIVLNNIRRNNIVKSQLITVDITGPNYATGGSLLTPAMLGLNTIDFIITEPNGGYIGIYDYTNQKLMFYWAPAGTSRVLAEITNATDLTASTFKVMVIGR
jgi:hypothetical protein